MAEINRADETNSHLDKKVKGEIGFKVKLSYKVQGKVPMSEKNFKMILNLDKVLSVFNSSEAFFFSVGYVLGPTMLGFQS